MYTLNDICSVITDGSHFSPEDEGVGYPMLSVKDMRETDFDFGTCKHVGEEAFQKLLSNGCKPEINDVVVAKDGSYLKTAFPIKEDRDIALLSSIAILRPKLDIVLPEYLSYFLKSETVYRTVSLNYISGTALKRVILKGIKKIPVSLPTVEEQGRRTELLDKIYGIIQQRKKQLAELDDLIKARFVEMFGDPVANPKGWPMPLIEDVVSKEKNALKAGPFGSALKKEYYVESGYKIYGQEQVISGDPNYGDYYIDEERYRQLENCAVQAGDVLISLVGTYGKLLIMPDCFEPGIINPRLMKITFDKNKVNPYYFQHYFQSDSLRRSLADNTHGGTMDILNLGIVRKLKMPLPPIELQNEFVAFVTQVDKSKVAVQKALDKTQVLFNSAMQQYFD